MILQGKLSSVFTPNSLHALNNNLNQNRRNRLRNQFKLNQFNNNKNRFSSKNDLYFVDDSYPSVKTISIEYKCDKNYVG